MEIGEQFRHAVETLHIAHRKSEFGHVTVSVGVASGVPGRDFKTPQELVLEADAALYAAKASGRNRVSSRGDALAAAG